MQAGPGIMKFSTWTTLGLYLTFQISCIASPCFAQSASSPDSLATKGVGPGTKTGFQCLMEGKGAAKEGVSKGGNFAGGLVLGCFLGLIGTGIAVLTTGEPDTPYLLLPTGESDECKSAFIEGYKQEGKSKKKSAALAGGLVGTAILIVVIVAASSSDSGDDYYYSGGRLNHE